MLLNLSEIPNIVQGSESKVFPNLHTPCHANENIPHCSPVQARELGVVSSP